MTKRKSLVFFSARYLAVDRVVEMLKVARCHHQCGEDKV